MSENQVVRVALTACYAVLSVGAMGIMAEQTDSQPAMMSQSAALAIVVPILLGMLALTWAGEIRTLPAAAKWGEAVHNRAFARVIKRCYWLSPILFFATSWLSLLDWWLAIGAGAATWWLARFHPWYLAGGVGVTLAVWAARAFVRSMHEKRSEAIKWAERVLATEATAPEDTLLRPASAPEPEHVLLRATNPAAREGDTC